MLGLGCAEVVTETAARLDMLGRMLHTIARTGLLLCCVLPACAQWQVLPSPTSADLESVAAVSDQVAWASGGSGTVLRTDDGGAHWQACPPPADGRSLDFRGVQGFDGKTALVMSSGLGELSRVYRTTDGCRTWERVFTNPNPEGSLDAMQFQWKAQPLPAKGYYGRGILIGHPVDGAFVIYTSRDHGSTWLDLHDDEAFSPGPSAWAQAGEAMFATSNTALTAAADENGFAFVTGGSGGARLLYPESHHQDFDYVSVKWTFTALQLPMPAGAAAGAYSIAARPAGAEHSDLMVVGGDASRPEVGSAVFLRHGGAVLSVKKLVTGRVPAGTHAPSGYRTAVAYLAASDSWVTVGPNGTDLSRDDGRSWTRLQPSAGEQADADQHWQAMSFPFVAGPHGRLGRWTGTAVRAPAAEKPVQMAAAGQ